MDYLLTGLIFLLPTSSTSSSCTTLYQHNTTSITRQTRVLHEPGFVGLVTIVAEVNRDSTAPWEFLRFMETEKINPLVIQVFSSDINMIRLYMEDEEVMESGGMSRNVDYNTTGMVHIQISSTRGDNGYHVNLGLDDAGFTYRNSNPELWMKHSGSRIGDVTTFKADNAMLVLKSVLLCDENNTSPRVLDAGSVELGFRGAGEVVEMSCQAEGAPFHQAIWTTPDGMIVGANDSALVEHTQANSTNTGTTSTLTIRSFNPQTHAGAWTCHYRNINYNTTSPTTRTFSILSILSNDTTTPLDHGAVYRWVIIATEDTEFNHGDCDVEVAMDTQRVGRRFNVSVTVSHLPNHIHSINCSIAMGSTNRGFDRITIPYYARRACDDKQIWDSERCQDCPILHNRDPDDIQRCIINMVLIGPTGIVTGVFFLILIISIVYRFHGYCGNKTNNVDHVPVTTGLPDAPSISGNISNDRERGDEAAFPDGRERKHVHIETPIN